MKPGSVVASMVALLLVEVGWAKDIAVRGETVYTMAGSPTANGVVLVRDGLIRRVGRPMLRAGGEARNATFEAGRLLKEAGVPFAFQSGYEGYVPKSRVLLFEASIAAANGLSLEDTLRAMTLTPAELLGVDDVVGSLERGKHGDLVLFDGDPFEYTSHVCGVVIEGELVSDACW